MWYYLFESFPIPRCMVDKMRMSAINSDVWIVVGIVWISLGNVSLLDEVQNGGWLWGLKATCFYKLTLWFLLAVKDASLQFSVLSTMLAYCYASLYW